MCRDHCNGVSLWDTEFGFHSAHNKEKWGFTVKEQDGKLLRGNIRGKDGFCLNSPSGILA